MIDIALEYTREIRVLNGLEWRDPYCPVPSPRREFTSTGIDTWPAILKASTPQPVGFLYGVNWQESSATAPTIFLTRRNLFGTQTYEQYSECEVTELAKKIKKNGFESQKPIVVVPLFGENETVAAVVDGHHRVRASGKAKIKDPLPCKVLSPHEAVIAIRSSKAIDVTPEQLEESLRFAVSRAQASFDFLPRVHSPYSLKETNSLEDLFEKYGKVH